MEHMSVKEFDTLRDGDIVTIREFDDLCEEYGKDDSDGMPLVPLGFNGRMAILCGKEATVRDNCCGIVKLDNNMWDFGKEMFKPGHRSIPDEDIQNEWNILMFGEDNERQQILE